VDVRVSRRSSPTDKDTTVFHIETELKGDLSQREKILLFNSARKCDVSKLLAGQVNFEYLLRDGDGA
jgi:uncharacterized OsmC-like protein